MQTDSKDEAIAFLASALESLPAEERESYAARCVVVDSQSAWRQLVVSETSLILIPTFIDRAIVSNALQQGHYVFVPLDNADSASPSTIKLPRLHRENAKKALLEMGIPDTKAGDLATLTRRSLSALRRKLAINPGAQFPAWSTPSEARKLLPLLILGKWDDTNVADREIVAKLSRTSYEEINEVLSRWTNEANPPVRRIGNIWLLISKEDTWNLLARFLTREDLDNIENVILDVLGQVDPSAL